MLGMGSSGRKALIVALKRKRVGWGGGVVTNGLRGVPPVPERCVAGAAAVDNRWHAHTQIHPSDQSLFVFHAPRPNLPERAASHVHPFVFALFSNYSSVAVVGADRVTV